MTTRESRAKRLVAGLVITVGLLGSGAIAITGNHMVGKWGGVTRRM